jgi:hypothetical protein
MQRANARERYSFYSFQSEIEHRVSEIKVHLCQLLTAKSQLGEFQSLRHKFQCQQGRLQEILVCLDVGMSYLHDAKQLKEYFAVSEL